KEKTMDKTKALERLTALESEASALRKIIEAPEPAPSLLTKPKLRSRVYYWAVGHTTGGGTLTTNSLQACSLDPEVYVTGNIFQTEALAQSYAEAIDTMLLLRHQPGTVPAAN